MENSHLHWPNFQGKGQANSTRFIRREKVEFYNLLFEFYKLLSNSSMAIAIGQGV